MNLHNEYTLKKYERNINNVINFISKNVHRDLSLDELSGIACFSRYHFHRIFKALVGETVNDFKNRLQIEKAAYMLIYNFPKPITELSIDCGFSSSQNFAKAFKKYFNMTPTQYRNENYLRKKSNTGNINSKRGNDKKDILHYTDCINNDDCFIKLGANNSLSDKVEIKILPDFHVVYARRIGEYVYDQLRPLFDKIIRTGMKYNLINDESLIFGVCWDYVAITHEEKCRYDACITIPENFDSSGELITQVLNGGRFAVYKCNIFNHDFYKEWDKLLHDWLPSSGYDLDDKPCYEIFYDLKGGTSRLDYALEICLPVK